MKPIFADHGVHIVCDGQFGSTGKGVLAAYLAEKALEQGVSFNAVLSNAGPNSGHTFYDGDTKHVLKQLPTFAVASSLMGRFIAVYLTAGAIIDPDILRTEAERYPLIPIYVHPNAAVVTEDDRFMERHSSIAAVAGTRSGTGAALARKVYRDPDAVWGSVGLQTMPPNVHTMIEHDFILPHSRVFMEISQGFSLGINSQFYPKVTSRECTVMQGIADARIAPKFVTRTYLSVRTLPIRVGNVDGHSSGDCYPDQFEIDWKDIGVEPELTTVTKRPRRIFSFSKYQFEEAILANQPDVVFLNFTNYLTSTELDATIRMMEEAGQSKGVEFDILLCDGPKSENVTEL